MIVAQLLLGYMKAGTGKIIEEYLLIIDTSNIMNYRDHS